MATGSVTSVGASEAISASSGGNDSLADAGAAYAAAQAAADAKRAADAGKVQTALEGMLVGIMFTQLSNMRKTATEFSNKSKERLNDMKELDAELEQ
jgi:hypothetical protein